MLAALILPLMAQASAPDSYELAAPVPQTLEQTRLTACLDLSRTDPTTAIANASEWAGEAAGAEIAFPQQCLGMAYTRLLRWQASEEAFLAAREHTLAIDPRQRARLAAMAGNSALADGRSEDALADLALASEDALQAGDIEFAGEVQIDRSRALVALGRMHEAAAALADARRDAPQDAEGWLLSATLARRQGDLETAQAQILTASGLAPLNPSIGLEAGVIAALAGNDDAARKSWQSVVSTSPGTPEAETARSYLAQLGDAPAANAEGNGG